MRKVLAFAMLILLIIVALSVRPQAVWNPFAKKTYNLTVINGTGGGTYAAGTKVQIVATPSPNSTFAAWLSAGQAKPTEKTFWGTAPQLFDNANASTATFTMPKHDDTVQATYLTP